MHTVQLILTAGWTAFCLYWLIAAFSVKRGRVAWGRHVRIRLIIIALAVALSRLGAFRHHEANAGPLRGGVGIALFAVGLATAVWARLHIGRNWGTPMTQKDDPELVTSGPYRFVRHPIYSGILLAGVGTAVALGWVWLVVVAIAGVYFGYAATVEEKFLTERFPDTYPAYQRSSKMLLPFVF
ncbi:MAG TPA: isoprenylcysteine carboxylmethyltransferase family protein [Mycobacteriales bacterium]|nr:isoprenylcysteine carboxylmethyltransferase family protein [Mycobacteriales bacterium]